MSVQNQVIPINSLINIELRRNVVQYSDWLKEKAEQMLDEIGDTGLSETQVNGLLSVANTSISVASISRFIERQVQRHVEWQKNDLGKKLLSEMKNLNQNAKTLAEGIQGKLIKPTSPQSSELSSLNDPKGGLPEIHYLLVREFIQSFGVGYLYRYKKRRIQGEREEGEE